MIPPCGELVAVAGPTQAAIEASSRIADVLRSAIGERGRASLALSGGNTPRGAYELLAHEAGIDWSKVDVFWVDERAALPTDDRSNYRWAKAALLDAVPALAGRAVRMEAERPDSQAAALEYEKVLGARVMLDAQGVPSFDVMVLGIGDDGHTASLFPGEPTIDIEDRWVAAVPAGSGREGRLTLTAPVIRHARHVLVVVVGEGKRAAIHRTWEPQGDAHATPARVICTCLGTVLWIVDKTVLGD